MAKRRRRSGRAGGEAVPFSRGEPARVADLGVDVDDTSVQVRLDGPSGAQTASTSSSGRDITGVADPKSDMQKLEQFVTSDEMWRIAEPIIEAHERFVGSRTAGCAPAYNIMDILVFEMASWVYRMFLGAHNNLYKDLKNWQRLVDITARDFPDNPRRRLSATPPSRYQHHRARERFLRNHIDELHAAYREVAVDTALHMGMFDPDAGTFSRPDKHQFVAGDNTWMPAHYNRHRSKAVDAGGRVRRHDPEADYYHNNVGERSKTPGRGLVLVSSRNPYPNERIVLDARFMPPKGDPAVAGRNDADICGDMFIELLDEFPILDARVHGLVYDGAADSELVDRLHTRGKHAVVPPRKTSKGTYAAANLGAHDFTTADGAVSSHIVTAIAGCAVVAFADGTGDEFYVPLDCKQRKRVTSKGRHRLYGVFEIPADDLVPQRLIGARTLIAFNSTQTEIDAKPHKRRTRALRTIQESDPRCARIRGLRPDIEALNSHIKNLLPTSGRLRTSQPDDSRLNILAYCMLQLSAATTAHTERLAHASATAQPPKRRAGPRRTKRPTPVGEPLPQAA